MEGNNNQYMDWDVIFNSIGDGIFIADERNTIIKANTAFAELLNMKVEDIVGKKCYELVHKTNTPWPGCPFEKSKKDKKVHVEEVNDPGIGVPLLITTSPIFSPSGEMIGVAHISKDISLVKKVQAQRKKMEEDLKKKIEDLERFQKITVGRELKMKELKARIAELEAKTLDRRYREQ
ncbi:MAG: PAS domain-containing protein [Candidatus Omnitrophota bacterium]|nr:PAS domain-containing protein [Candidatus Omnitrophota bacterium]